MSDGKVQEILQTQADAARTIQDLDDHVADLEKQLELKENELKESNHRLDAMNKIARTRQEEVNTRDKQITELSGLLKAQEDMVLQWHNRSDLLERELQNLRRTAANLQRRNASLQSKNTKFEQDAKSLSDSVIELQEQKQRLQKDKAILQAEKSLSGERTKRLTASESENRTYKESLQNTIIVLNQILHQVKIYLRRLDPQWKDKADELPPPKVSTSASFKW